MQLVRTAPRHQNNQRINGIRAVQPQKRERERLMKTALGLQNRSTQPDPRRKIAARKIAPGQINMNGRALRVLCRETLRSITMMLIRPCAPGPINFDSALDVELNILRLPWDLIASFPVYAFLDFYCIIFGGNKHGETMCTYSMII